MIRLDAVTKEYTGPLGGRLGGRVRALDEVTLEVPEGVSLGIVGPNGAGKSTLLRLLLGYLRPTAGRASVGGLPPRNYAERFGIGYVPERPTIPPRWTVRGSLRAFAALGDVEPWLERTEAALRRFGLGELAGRRVGALSQGNLQRLALAQAMLADRAVLILDEPTTAVDPEWTARVREIVRDWRNADARRVLLFASHNLDEVERVADRVAVLAEGRLQELIELGSGSAATLPPYRLELDGGGADVAALVERLFPGAAAETEAETGSAWRVTAADLPELNRKLGRLLAEGATLRSLVPQQPTLEQQFRRSLRGASHLPGSPR